MLTPNKFANIYSHDEDKLIIRLKEKENRSWAEIATSFPGRTAGALQARYSRKLTRRSEGPNTSADRATSRPSSAATTTSDDVNDATTSVADSFGSVSDDDNLMTSDKHDTGANDDDDDDVDSFKGTTNASAASISPAVTPGNFETSDPITPTDLGMIHQNKVLPPSTAKITLPECINLNNIIGDVTNSGRRSMRHHHSVPVATLNPATQQHQLSSSDHISDIAADIPRKSLQIAAQHDQSHLGPSSRSHKAKMRPRPEEKQAHKPSHEAIPRKRASEDQSARPSHAKNTRAHAVGSGTDVEIWKRDSDGSFNFNKPNPSCPLNLKLNHVKIVKPPLVPVDKNAPHPVPQTFNRHTILAGFSSLPDDADVRYLPAPPLPSGTVREGKRVSHPIVTTCHSLHDVARYEHLHLPGWIPAEPWQIAALDPEKSYIFQHCPATRMVEYNTRSGSFRIKSRTFENGGCYTFV